MAHHDSWQGPFTLRYVYNPLQAQIAAMESDRYLLHRFIIGFSLGFDKEEW